MRYWVAHTRGCNFAQLRKIGFTTFYPSMDDYVFLACKPETEKLLRKQSELGIAFVKKKGTPITISQAEVEVMAGETVNKLKVGDKVLVLQGFAENLRGEIIEEEDQKVRCILQGLTRTYDHWLDKQDVVADDGKPDAPSYGSVT